MIILLDLNYTLVSNSLTKKSPFTNQIEGEEYREWLIELVKPYTTILITARPQHHRDQTLQSIVDKTGWQPQDAYFNTYNLRPPQAKERMLIDLIFLRYGRDSPYLAIESNPRTRTMYAKYNIPSIFVEDGIEWTALPQLDISPMTSGNSMTA
jgi:hypothetical protein